MMCSIEQANGICVASVLFIWALQGATNDLTMCYSMRAYLEDDCLSIQWASLIANSRRWADGTAMESCICQR